MTQKDYIKLAKTLKEIYGWGMEPNERALFNGIVQELTKTMKEDNPRFNISTFRKAVYGNSFETKWPKVDTPLKT